MKKQIAFACVCLVLLAGFSACSPEPEAVENEFVLSNGSGVWFDNPLDQAVISIPAHISIVVHGNVPEGISGFEYWLDGNSWGVYPTVGDDYGASFVQSGLPWVASSSGWHTLKVAVLSMTGQPAAYAEIDVFLGDNPDEEDVPEEEAEAEPALAPTPEVVYSRCDLFDGLEPTLTLFDLDPGTNQMMTYINFGTLPGLEEPVEGDEDEWVYTAFMGNTEADFCRYEGYAGRLYCYFTFTERDYNTVQRMESYVNYCEEPIFIHEAVSIVAPVCERDMNQDGCEATGGEWYCDRFNNCGCICP